MGAQSGDAVQRVRSSVLFVFVPLGLLDVIQTERNPDPRSRWLV
jgi:hypothetical protein